MITQLYGVHSALCPDVPRRLDSESDSPLLRGVLWAAVFSAPIWALIAFAIRMAF